MCAGCRVLSFLEEKIKEGALVWLGRRTQFADFEKKKLLIHNGICVSDAACNVSRMPRKKCLGCRYLCPGRRVPVSQMPSLSVSDAVPELCKGEKLDVWDAVPYV